LQHTLGFRDRDARHRRGYVEDGTLFQRRHELGEARLRPVQRVNVVDRGSRAGGCSSCPLARVAKEKPENQNGENE
jgi:hypothetical protein